MSSITRLAIRAPSTLGDIAWNGADPVAADLASAPPAIVTGAMGSQPIQSTVSQWMGADTPGSLDSWLSQPSVSPSAASGLTSALTSTLGMMGGPVTSAAAIVLGGGGGSGAQGKGWYSSQPVYVKVLIVVGAIGLILIGVSKMFAPEIKEAAAAAAA